MKPVSRRRFLKRSALLGAGAFTLPRFSIAQSGPGANGKLNLALIGAGGGIVKGSILGAKEENLVAICDGPVWALGLYEPTVIEAEKIEGLNPGMCPDRSILRWDFAARGEMPPCTLRWYDGDLRPPMPGKWTCGEPPEKGTFFHGSKSTIFLDHASNNPRMISKEEMQAFKEAGMPPEKYPRVKDGPMAEWIRAIKGEGPEPGSNFDYSSRLTELACLGALVQRFGGRIEWDSKNLRAINRPELAPYIKEPVAKGWEYGEDLWKT